MEARLPLSGTAAPRAYTRPPNRAAGETRSGPSSDDRRSDRHQLARAIKWGRQALHGEIVQSQHSSGVAAAQSAAASRPPGGRGFRGRSWGRRRRPRHFIFHAGGRASMDCLRYPISRLSILSRGKAPASFTASATIARRWRVAHARERMARGDSVRLDSIRAAELHVVSRRSRCSGLANAAGR